MKAKIRKTGEIVDVICYGGSPNRRSDALDYVNYIDSQGVEHAEPNNLNYYWDFEPIETTTDEHWQQKAQRYDEALKVAKSKIKNDKDHILYEDDVIEIFPELEKSKDERIRNFISNELACLRATDEKGSDRYEELTKAIAWLEKQKSEEINVKALLTADKFAAAEMTGRLKERKEIVENPQKYGLEKQGEQKPAWSEEDEARFESCIKILQTSDGYDTINTKWLKSLKNRVQPQPKQEWSKEDEEMLRRCISATFDHGYLKECDWLKSFKDKVQSQPRQEWDEKGKCMLNNVIDTLKPLSQTTHSGYAINSMIDWLKSLRPQNWTKEDKERYISCLQRLSTGNPEQPETINSKWFKEHVYPQSTWKPSDEQMDALWDSIKHNLHLHPVLKLLYNDLKKLREK